DPERALRLWSRPRRHDGRANDRQGIGGTHFRGSANPRPQAILTATLYVSHREERFARLSASKTSFLTIAVRSPVTHVACWRCLIAAKSSGEFVIVVILLRKCPRATLVRPRQRRQPRSGD